MEEVTARQIHLWADQYLKGIISPEDKASFETWYNAMDEGTIEWNDDTTPSAEALRTQVLQAIYERIKAEGVRPRDKKTIGLRKLAAAVVMLLMLGAGGYWIYGRNGRSEPMANAHQLKNDLPPGGNKAVLTLSNGTRVVLDSAHSGQLLRLGDAQVKVDSGVLAYGSLEGISNSIPKTSYNILTTPIGGKYRLILPDGTKVWLNAASSIRYPTVFTGSKRNVKVTGEVYFEVVKDAGKPFEVSVNNIKINVLGTNFNVMDYSDETSVKTTLLEGSVKVTTKGSGIILTQGQQAIINRGVADIKVKKVNLAEVTAWKDNLFQFDDDDLPSIMRKIARWYGVKVSYKGTVPARHFTGVISRNNDLSQVLKILKRGGLHLTFDGKTISVMP